MIAMRILLGILVAALLAGPALPAAADEAEVAPVPRAKPDPPPRLLRDEREAALRRAFEQAEHGRLKSARAALPDLAQVSAERAARIKKLVTWTAYRAGATEDFETIRRFAEDHSNWPRARTLRRRVEESVTSYTPDSAILDWFADHPPVTARGKLHYAEALFRAGEEERAAKLLAEGWRRARLTRSHERRILRRYGDRLTPADHIARVDYLLWRRARPDAYRMLSHLPDGERALARARIALIGFAWDVDERIDAVPKSLRADAGLVYDRVYWRRVKGKHDAARELLLSASVDGADILRPARWWRERHYQARRALRQGKAQTAYRLAAEHSLLAGHRQSLETLLDTADDPAALESAETPDLSRATRAAITQAEWLAGWIALRYKDRPDTAMRHFQTAYAVVDFPVSLARGAYWAGRAAEASGESARARRWYEQAARHPDAYYGQLALERLGGDMSLVARAQVGIEEEARQRFAQRELVRAAELLAKIDADDPLRDIIRHLTRTAETRAEKALVAELSDKLERSDMGVIAAELAARQGDLLLKDGYPIIETPDQLTVADSLIHAIARQESRFDPQAKSHAGALGLMQLMPATALRVARRIEVPYSKQRLIRDPQYNLKLGARYVEQLLQRYSGSPVLALAAYNAGPVSVNRWLRQYGDPRNAGLDPVDWIELIPYSETRDYVQRVLESAAIYDVRFGRDGGATGLARYLGRRATQTATAGEESGGSAATSLPGG